jgi:hypothetical protein
MKNKFISIILILIFCFALFSCSKDNNLPDGAKTIEGSYASYEYGFIGYDFMSDGYGFQFIGENVYRIRYYILGGKITIENFSIEGGKTATFDFSQENDHIFIGGMEFEKADFSDISSQTNNN